MSSHRKLDYAKLFQLIRYMEAHPEEISCANLSKALGFAASDYLERLVCIGKDGPLHVIHKSYVNRKPVYFYHLNDKYSDEALAIWLEDTNRRKVKPKGPKRKYVKSGKYATPEPTPEPAYSSTAQTAIDTLADLIAENEQLKKKLEQIRCLL